MSVPDYTIRWEDGQGIHLEGRDCADDAYNLAKSKNGVAEDCAGNTIADFTGTDEADDSEDCFPYNVTDCSDDADVLASAGMGTDEDYGCFCGGEDY